MAEIPFTFTGGTISDNASVSIVCYVANLITGFKRLGFGKHDLHQIRSQLYITEMFLGNCSISTVDFTAFWNLKILSLGENNITHLRGIGTLRYLEYLHLGTNSISELPPEMNNPCLRVINLGNNNITSISNPELRLRELILGENKIVGQIGIQCCILTTTYEVIPPPGTTNVIWLQQGCLPATCVCEGLEDVHAPFVKFVDIEVLTAVKRVSYNGKITTCVDINLPQIIDLFCEK